MVKTAKMLVRFAFADRILCISIFICAMSGSSVAASMDPPFPVYPEQFIVKTREYSSGGEMTLNQTLVWDESAQRTLMKADFVGQGDLEQIVRSDVTPSYFVQASSTDPSEPSSWDCSNTTMEIVVTGFWDVPLHSRFSGNETVNGVVCGKWVYTVLEIASEYVFWGSDDSPCATAQLVPGSDDGDYMWRIEFHDFLAGPPPLDAYEPTPGVTCPLAEDGAKNTGIPSAQPPGMLDGTKVLGLLPQVE